MKKFWKWTNRTVTNQENQTETVERTLFLNGTIAEESWFDDDITPQLFKEELMAGSGDITVWINSPGGDCVAAAQIYNMLMDYKGNVTVKIDGIAASAASVIAMAGTKVLVSPVSMMMIHNPMTVAMGDTAEMQKAIEMLGSVKDSIINAYEQKCHLSRSKIAKMMSEETWLNAKKALQLGFVDGILFAKEKMPQAEPEEEEEESTEEESSEEAPDEEDDDEDDPDKKEKKPPKDMVSFSYTPARTAASFMQKVSATQTGTPIAQLDKRLELLKY